MLLQPVPRSESKPRRLLPRAGRSAGRAGRKDDAFRLIEGWVQRAPTCPDGKIAADAKIELARLNDEFGNRQVAQEQLIEALAADPNNSRALTALGKIREEAGDKAQALANYRRSLAEDDRQPEVAMRVTALQGGPVQGVPAPAGSPPTVEQGTRMADRSPAPPAKMIANGAMPGSVGVYRPSLPVQ